MSNKKQTAVEWFNQQLLKRQNGSGDSRSWDEILEQAKELEKQQITEGYFKGFTRELGNRDEDAEGYYNETYGGNK